MCNVQQPVQNDHIWERSIFDRPDGDRYEQVSLYVFSEGTGQTSDFLASSRNAPRGL